MARMRRMEEEQIIRAASSACTLFLGAREGGNEDTGTAAATASGA
jgi:hypothetical protein